MSEVEVGGVRLSYERRGSGFPLVLVHGLGGTSAAIWRHHADALARDFDVVAYDLRGCGRSAAPAGPYLLADFVGDLDGLAGALGLERVALLGHSFGGSIVLEYAARHPGRVAAAVVAGGPTEFADTTREALRARAETVEASGMAAVAETVATNGMAPSFREASPGELRAYVDLLLANDPAAYAATCRAVAALDITAGLGRIEAPVLLVAGDRDGVAPPEQNRRSASLIPDARFVEVADCGHILPWEQPATLLEAARPFLLAHAG